MWYMGTYAGAGAWAPTWPGTLWFVGTTLLSNHHHLPASFPPYSYQQLWRRSGEIFEGENFCRSVGKSIPWRKVSCNAN